jgi:glycosyltransferase involved in cell wall biosynthesis
MKILLTSGASYAPPKGGSTRGNLAWLRLLAERGHTCRVVCSAGSEAGEMMQDGVSILRIPDLPLHAGCLTEAIRAFAPDWVLVSSEDVTQRLLRAAERGAPGKLIYIAHTPQFFPFGPESWNPDAEATRVVERSAGVVTIGSHMAGYVREHCAARPVVIHPPIYDRSLDKLHRAAEGGIVLMINPCVVKGISIFLALAERFPEREFGALTGWGTTSADRAALQKLPNVRLIPAVGEIDEVFRETRVLLMPSLWYEGFGLIVMEAMQRGVPVISSDSGGLKEAKDSSGYVIPVRPIERYEAVFDENHMPRPVAPEQDIAPWETALRTLLTDRMAYLVESECSSVAAKRFVNRLRPGAFEEYLLGLKPRLSDAQRELLRKRLGG